MEAKTERTQTDTRSTEGLTPTWKGTASLSGTNLEVGADRPLSAYIHIPFCDQRCGYCDFNTYIADFGEGASRGTYHQSVVREIARSAQTLNSWQPPRALRSIFFGGGTPSLLDPALVHEILGTLESVAPFADDIEITLEANPDTLDHANMRQFHQAGINRVSIGMQSAVPHVLSALDRTHRMENVAVAVQAAKDEGAQVSLDLIYGAPSESLYDWASSVQSAIDLDPDHVSAYSLIIEPNTKMGRDLEKGLIPPPNIDLEADKYRLATGLLEEAGFHWYEISNFATSHATESTHNKAYWQDYDWWGYGAGAHSHLGKVRWWNAAHPTAYAGLTSRDGLAGVGGEVLTAEERHTEKVMLAVRTSQGIHKDLIAGPNHETKAASHRIQKLRTEGLLEPSADLPGQWTLTLRGRLLADYATRVLLGWE